MPVFVSKVVGILKIPNGQTTSNVLKSNVVFEDAVAAIIYAVNATDGVLTYKIQVSNDIDAGTPVWFDLEDNTPAVIPAPNITGKARVYSPSLTNWWGAASGMRIVSSAVTTADRFWDITKQFLA